MSTLMFPGFSAESALNHAQNGYRQLPRNSTSEGLEMALPWASGHTICDVVALCANGVCDYYTYNCEFLR